MQFVNCILSDAVLLSDDRPVDTYEREHSGPESSREHNHIVHLQFRIPVLRWGHSSVLHVQPEQHCGRRVVSCQQHLRSYALCASCAYYESLPVQVATAVLYSVVYYLKSFGNFLQFQYYISHSSAVQYVPVNGL